LAAEICLSFAHHILFQLELDRLEFYNINLRDYTARKTTLSTCAKCNRPIGYTHEATVVKINLRTPFVIELY